MKNDFESFESRARSAADAVKAGANDSTNTLTSQTIAERSERHNRARTIRTSVLTITTALLVIATGGFGATQFATQKQKSPSGEDAALAPFALAGDLKPFNACDDALQYFTEHAPDYYIESMENGSVPFASPNQEALGRSESRSADAPSPQTMDAPESSGRDTSTPTPEHSTTNVQEKGVDEPDVLKTDGSRVFAISQGHTYALTLDQGKPVRVATFDTPQAQSLLLDGDRLLILSSDSANDGPIPLDSAIARDLPTLTNTPTSRVTAFDVSDIAHPKQLHSLRIDGTIIDARMVGSIVRVVTQWAPDVQAPSPQFENGKLTERSKQAMREAISVTRIEDWVPQLRILNPDGAEEWSRPLVSCDRLARPSVFSGINTVAVSSFNLQDDVANTSSVGVIAGGERVYANATRLYVSSMEWKDRSPIATTRLHKFAADSADKSGLAMTYRGSGEVRGHLLNSYAMSEHDDVLRVATTLSGRFGWVRQSRTSEGAITTLAERDGRLQQLGYLDGLGRKDAESIRAVRFVGDKGYVVTFRQTDPLYVIDLRDPAIPKVTGELKIPGFSGYLHPVGKDQLLGVGQGSADELDARTTPPTGPQPESGTGTDPSAASPPGAPIAPSTPVAPVRPVPTTNLVQFRLFDVSNPYDPRLVDTRTYGSGSAGATFDPKAFLYWEPRNLVIAPASFSPISPTDNHSRRTDTSDVPSTATTFDGLLLLSPSSSALVEAGRLSYVFRSLNTYANVTRTMVIGDNVYMLSDVGLQANALDTHQAVGQVEFS